MANAWRILVIFNLILTCVFLYAFFGVYEKVYQEPDLTNSPQEHDTCHEDDPYFANNVIKLHRICLPFHQKPLFQKMVFIVIDAFRADFMPSTGDTDRQSLSPIASAMPYTQSLLKSYQAINFIGLAQSPTVTMPRLKAILAGIKPSFIDLLINLNAAQFGEDNIVNQARRNGKRMVFYGDDTWLQMFPRNYFIRSNETFSFFATDYTQVDDNVTNCMLPELNKLDDWDIMFLHYLGVDHIGHSFGSSSSLLPAKLKEMDSVISRIHKSISQRPENYLVVVTGDHGMTDSGNHGGSSNVEVETGLLFINSRAKKTSKTSIPNPMKVRQTDLASTISLLLGLEIPRKSCGKLITNLLEAWDDDSSRLACHLFQNSMQIKRLLECNSLISKFKSTVERHLYAISHNASFESVEKEYITFLNQATNILFSRDNKNSVLSVMVQILVIFLQGVILYKIFRLDIKSTNSILSASEFQDPLVTFATLVLVFGTFLLGSTSFVENEAQFWSYNSSTLVVLNLFRLISKKRPQATGPNLNIFFWPFDYVKKLMGHIGVIILLRFTSHWSEIRFTHLDSWMETREYRSYWAALIIISLVIMSLLSSKSRFSKQQCINASGFLFIYLYRCDSNLLAKFRVSFLSLFPKLSAIFKARLVYLHIAMLLIEELMRIKRLNFRWGFVEDLIPQRSHRITSENPSMMRSFTSGWILLISLLVKPSNIPLVALTIWTERLVFSITKWSLTKDRIIYFIVVYTTFGFHSFYSQGNSNSISTIDVSSGYVGLDSYIPLLTGFLIACHTYGLFLFWILIMFLRISETKTSLWFVKTADAFDGVSRCLIILFFQRLVFFQIVAFLLSNHLFIWTVISPKLLYEASCSLVISTITGIIILFLEPT